MFAVNPNYNELALKQIKRASIYTIEPSYELRKQVRLREIQKICPRCGAFLTITAKGCDNCLFQFDTSRKND